VFAFLVAARFADPIVSLPPYQFARDKVRQNLEKANQRVYGKGRVLRFHDVPSPAEVQQEAVVCK
jgi:hypothetical protein